MECYERIYFRKKKQYKNKNYFQLINQKLCFKKQTECIIENAINYINTPYRYGGTNKSGIDCSAFIKNIFASYQIFLPRISYHQAKKGFFVPKEKIEKGDLLFFATGTSKKINHVGMVIHTNNNNNNIFFIHASTSNGVIISQLYQKYWNHRFITARRILYPS
ncbi:C40 family peptidase [Blattabacterium sp. (Blaberus giganteus)]|uniref:C40 family peptidase n=1 Tax=Blattabacterium sp. (Blaberus giganteus) TaxID=1186051 RepID=UPI00025F6EE7|nr:C40 family peptidase [Blattabacterium sp. (Blaberus giganteus)]AFJ90677.1 NLP/P60 family protein [Blattabacterium sp. (Blaberus giganteus)]